MHVIPMNNSNLIKVTYEARSPQTAEQVLTELGNLYLLKHATIHHRRAPRSSSSSKADQYKTTWADAQVALGQNESANANRFRGTSRSKFTLQKLSDFDVLAFSKRGRL